MSAAREAVVDLDGRRFGCLGEWAPALGPPEAPLIVCLHGGTYTARYFDVPGHSLLQHAAALALPVVAIDRPGYGVTGAVESADYSHMASAVTLARAIDDLWAQAGDGRPGIVLFGHSIGGAIALRIAAAGPRWPLLGVAVSGLGLHLAPRSGGERFPPTPFVDLPPELKQRQMFGPAGSYDPAAPAASRVADAPAPVQELIDIATTWPREMMGVLSSVAVPIHYRQGEWDGLWTVTPAEVEAFAAACGSAPSVDAGIVRGAGHCIDFHRQGFGFQLEQLAFAMSCGAAWITHSG